MKKKIEQSRCEFCRKVDFRELFNWTSVHYLDLDVRTYIFLQGEQITTMNSLLWKSEEELRKNKNCGRKTLRLIKEALQDKGLALRGGENAAPKKKGDFECDCRDDDHG